MTTITSDTDYQSLVFEYQRCSDQDASRPVRHPVVVVGAGPVGLSVAIDLAQQGERIVLIDDDDRLSNGSRAICFAKRTLEIFDRLGSGQPMVDKGVVWNLGKVFFRSEPVYSFNLLPEAGHQRPAFVNLQQYYVEGYLLDRAGNFQTSKFAGKTRSLDFPRTARVSISRWRLPMVTTGSAAIGWWLRMAHVARPVDF